MCPLSKAWIEPLRMAVGLLTPEPRWGGVCILLGTKSLCVVMTSALLYKIRQQPQQQVCLKINSLKNKFLKEISKFSVKQTRTICIFMEIQCLS